MRLEEQLLHTVLLQSAKTRIDHKAFCIRFPVNSDEVLIDLIKVLSTAVPYEEIAEKFSTVATRTKVSWSERELDEFIAEADQLLRREISILLNIKDLQERGTPEEEIIDFVYGACGIPKPLLFVKT